MAASDRRLTPSDWLSAHAVDVAFGLLALGWLAYILRITGEFSYWDDDLYLVEQGGSWSGLFESYNNHLSVAILRSTGHRQSSRGSPTPPSWSSGP